MLYLVLMVCVRLFFIFFFFKQKTAYEMRISDWSSDVCSSDLPASSLMLDDGEIERRVRLIRPMEQHHASLTMMAESHWVEADRTAFASAWTVEVADVPAFSESTIHVVSGLLLPIWKRLPNESTRVYRLQTDDGERIIGRKVSRSEEHTSELQSLMRSSYAVF